MSNMSNARKEFEAFQKNLGNKLKRNDNGVYADPAIRIAWDWFKIGYNINDINKSNK